MYPNPWCRVKRTGQTFYIYRRGGGMNWEVPGQTTWGPGGNAMTTNPMPATIYVGPDYSPENGNVSDVIDQGTFLAQFRDYGDVVSVTAPTLSASSLVSGVLPSSGTGRAVLYKLGRTLHRCPRRDESVRGYSAGKRSTRDYILSSRTVTCSD